MNSDLGKCHEHLAGSGEGLASVQAEFVVDEQNVTCFPVDWDCAILERHGYFFQMANWNGSPIAK